MDQTFLQVLTGCDMAQADPIKVAVATRFAQILPTLKRRGGLEVPAHLWHERHIYDGNRCKPENLGWRFRQSFGDPEPETILAGAWDAQIEATWHEAAKAEYWYAYEKQW